MEEKIKRKEGMTVFDVIIFIPRSRTKTKFIVLFKICFFLLLFYYFTIRNWVEFIQLYLRSEKAMHRKW